MKRDFKYNGDRFSIVNRYTAGMEINQFNMKYDIMMFDTNYNAWIRIGSCNTIASGHEIVENNF